MSNLHYITDEKLGGIEREYVESGKKADLGDFIHVTKYADCFEATIVKADRIDSFGDLISYEYPYTPEGDRYDLDEGDEFTALSPTANVRIDGGVYRLVDREATEGENILYLHEGKSDGVVLTVTGIDTSIVTIEPYEDEEGDEVVGINHGSYRVLEPVNPSPSETQSPKSTADIIATMARRLHEAESKISELTERLDSAEKDVRTFADEAMKTAYELAKVKADQAGMNEEFEDSIEMLTGDIVSLDERTQPEELARTISKELAKGARRYGVR